MGFTGFLNGPALLAKGAQTLQANASAAAARFSSLNYDGYDVTIEDDDIVVKTKETKKWNGEGEMVVERTSVEILRVSKKEYIDFSLRAPRSDMIKIFLESIGTREKDALHKLAELKTKFPEIDIDVTRGENEFGILSHRDLEFKLVFPADENGQRFSVNLNDFGKSRGVYKYMNSSNDVDVYEIIRAEIYTFFPSGQLYTDVHSKIRPTSGGWEVSDPSGTYRRTFPSVSEAKTWYATLPAFVMNQPGFSEFIEVLGKLKLTFRNSYGEYALSYGEGEYTWFIPNRYTNLAEFRTKVLVPLFNAYQRSGDTLSVRINDARAYVDGDDHRTVSGKVVWVVKTDSGEKTYESIEALSSAV